MSEREPDPALINSMALRMRHDFGLLPETTKDFIRADMRKVWEEVVGLGFYRAAPTPPAEPPEDEDTPQVAEENAARHILAVVMHQLDENPDEFLTFYQPERWLGIHRAVAGFLAGKVARLAGHAKILEERLDFTTQLAHNVGLNVSRSEEIPAAYARLAAERDKLSELNRKLVDKANAQVIRNGQLEAERDEAQKWREVYIGQRNEARAERDALRTALEECESVLRRAGCDVTANIARAALARAKENNDAGL